MIFINIPFSYNKVDCKKLNKKELIMDLLMELEEALMKNIDKPTEIRGVLTLTYNQIQE